MLKRLPVRALSILVGGLVAVWGLINFRRQVCSGRSTSPDDPNATADSTTELITAISELTQELRSVRYHQNETRVNVDLPWKVSKFFEDQDRREIARDKVNDEDRAGRRREGLFIQALGTIIAAAITAVAIAFFNVTGSMTQATRFAVLDFVVRAVGLILSAVPSTALAVFFSEQEIPRKARPSDSRFKKMLVGVARAIVAVTEFLLLLLIYFIVFAGFVWLHDSFLVVGVKVTVGLKP